MNLSRYIRRDFDLLLLLAVLAAVTLGIVTIYSATYDWDSEAAGNTYQKQATWAAIAIFALVVTMSIPLKFYYAFAYIIYSVAILLLVLVLEFGDRRWFDLGPIHVQPSELAKLATVLALARYLSWRNRDLARARSLLLPLLLVLLPAVLVYKQPDLGTSLVFCAILMPMLYWAGLSAANLFFIISPVLSLICAFHALTLGLLIVLIVLLLFRVRLSRTATITLLVINLTVAVGAPYIWDNKLRDYQQQRILTFLNPDMDKLGTGYQVIQSRVAIGSGGFGGKGFLQGTQTKLAFLPERHTDFIFSVVSEEFGFIGAISLLTLFFFVILRAIKIATLTKSRFASLLSIGLASILVFHVFVNIGMTIGLTPVTGLPLPFLSYGGSPLVTNLILVGLLLNVHARRHEYY